MAIRGYRTVRDFFAHHRLASGLIAPGALGIAALITVPLALSGGSHSANTELTASVTECHDMVTLSVAGRGDTPAAGTTKMLVDANGKALPAALSDNYSSHWVDPVVNAPAAVAKPGSYAALYIAYPADMDSYENAVDTGVANTESVMRQIQAACPNTKFSVVGYSEGADVARRVAMDVGHQQAPADGHYAIVDPAHVLGVVILADNGRTTGQGPFPGAKNPFSNPDGFDKTYQTGTTAASGQGAMTDTGGDDFGALNGRIASFCSDGDLTCAAPQNISLLQLAANVGRQLNVDALQKGGLTPATGQDVAVTLAHIAINAFSYIQSQPNWMQSNQTFLDVLLKVSDPSYKPEEATAGQTATDASGSTPSKPGQVPAAGKAAAITSDQMAPLAYLPRKLLNEIVGLIVTNQNTIPVVMNDPYQLTLGPGTGHHFDYWHDANPTDGKPLTSAEYAAAWLTYLAQQAQAGKPVDPAAKPDAKSIESALNAAQSAAAGATAAAPTTNPLAPAPATPTEAAADSAEQNAAVAATPTTTPATPAEATPTEAPPTEDAEAAGTESATTPDTSDPAAAATTAAAPTTTAAPTATSAAN
ncbi:cutinase family protein [Speluncibacter jeojiensis]|uniref:Cutinase family protein n=1 Tax=Speluncibacter jeojiensis TaxID=2710754 RepID=A0A9X4RCA0_9ACTN|nr:cutinase family protein [Corynebacteriales bacterium D3-21]